MANPRPDHIERLAALPLLTGLPESDLWLLAATGSWQSWPPGSVLMREGEEGNWLVIVVEGHAEIALGQGPGRVVIAVVGPGELLGEAVLFRRTVPRSAEVRAATTLSGMRLEVGQLDTLARVGNGVPRVIEMAVLGTLARRIAASRDLVSEMLRAGEVPAQGLLARLKGMLGR